MALQSRMLWAAGNDYNIQLLIHVTDCLTSHLRKAAEEFQPGKAAASVSNVNAFLFNTGLDSVNLFRLVRYAKETKILFRVAGFADALAVKEGAGIVQLQDPTHGDLGSQDEQHEGERTGSGTGALQALLAFLVGLNNRDEDGRILTDAARASFKFVLLNAAAHFAEVVDAAHAVILASGTLSPVASLQRLLFPDRCVRFFNCGHVVPEDQLLVVALGHSPSGLPLDFRHPQRSHPSLVEQLGRVLMNVSQVVPQGVVVFFPSFSYAAEVRAQWERCSIWSQLSAKKRIFHEPRKAAEVEAVLREYAECVNAAAQTPEQKRGGALLMCVVGGKMSEGINFGDGLGRCVVMVGMPFPNPSDPELVERMRYLDCKEPTPPTHQLATSGREFYEDLCMKAVNQCIGRVVRHKKDWAAILLADLRWAGGGKTPRQKLPGWMQRSLVVANGFGDGFSRLAKFCRAQSQMQQ